MHVQFADRVRVGTTTIGTGTLQLAGATLGMQPFASNVPDGARVCYTIEDGLLAWEVGYGTYRVGVGNQPDTLTRDTILDSTSNGQVIALSGLANVFITPNADWLNSLGGVSVSVTPPDLVQGALWFDPVSTQLFVGYQDSDSIQWVIANNAGATLSASGRAAVSPLPPTSPPPTNGSLWWDSAGGQLYLYFDDGSSQQWVAASNFTAIPISTTVPRLNISNIPLANPDGSPPAGSVKGDLYNNGGFVCIAQ